MQDKIVIKIGGSVLKDSNDLQNFVHIVNSYKHSVIIVVSAFNGITDLLVDEMQNKDKTEQSVISLADYMFRYHMEMLTEAVEDNIHIKKAALLLKARADELKKYMLGAMYIKHIPVFLYDTIISYGEKFSSLVCATLLQSVGHQCREELPEDLQLVTIPNSSIPTVDIHNSEVYIRERLHEDIYYVIPGFYAMTTSNTITLLGRGGTDYSASAIARCVFAISLDLWKDCEGFLSADPAIIPNARSISQLHYSEVAELSHFGAKILHPRTVEPLMDKSIPIRIFNSTIINSNEPISIINNEVIISQNIVKSIAKSNNFALLTITSHEVVMRYEILSKIILLLEQNAIFINTLMSSQSSFSLLLNRKDTYKAFSLVNNTFANHIKKTTIIDTISTIVLVGRGISIKNEILSKTVSVLTEKQIQTQFVAWGTTDSALYLSVSEMQAEEAVKAIHHIFFN